MNFSESKSIIPQNKENSKGFNLNSNKLSNTNSINKIIVPLKPENLFLHFDNYEPAKCSVKPVGNIAAYAANTYQGLVRDYNEDRVSIILNIGKPKDFTGKWPRCSIFAIYDGHGGYKCADFLKDHLHTYVVNQDNIISNPKNALINSFYQAEHDFIVKIALDSNKELSDTSGSCAILCLIIDNTCYFANVGDSRAIFSCKNGKEFKVITNDHKPNSEKEYKRIIKNGGSVYQYHIINKTSEFSLH